MQAHQLLTADILDILFEGRNKAYGAYVLRKEYNRRLSIALFSTAAFVSILFLIIPLVNKNNIPDIPKIKPPVIIEMGPVPPVQKKKAAIVPPSKPRAIPKPKLPSVQYVTPVVVNDDSIHKKDILPSNDDIDNARIASLTQQGTGTGDIVPPPDEAGDGNNVKPGKEDDENKIFTTVQHESEYPGGKNAWMRFLIKTFRYPSEAEDKEIEGTVTVQFIVDESGNVSHVQAISGPEELMKEAVRVIGKSGKWTAAMQNGRKVKSYKSQAIVFRLSK